MRLAEGAAPLRKPLEPAAGGVSEGREGGEAAETHLTHTHDTRTAFLGIYIVTDLTYLLPAAVRWRSLTHYSG